MKNSIRNQIIVAVLVSQVALAIGLHIAVVLYSRAQLLAGFDIMWKAAPTLSGRDP